MAPGFTNIGMIREIRGIAIAAQDVSPFPPGAYTGEINAKQLRELGVQYCIVGHSERRKWFHENHQEIANKCRELLEQRITPILCVDRDYLNAQIAVLESDWIIRLILAYEPTAAIGSGQAEDAREAGRMAEKIRAEAPEAKAVIYGGSVNAENAGDYLNSNLSEGGGFEGLLVGEKALKAADLLAIVKSVEC